MDRRYGIFAIALSFAVLFGLSVIFESPQVNEQKTSQQNESYQKTDGQNSDAPSVNVENKNVREDMEIIGTSVYNFTPGNNGYENRLEDLKNHPKLNALSGSSEIREPRNSDYMSYYDDDTIDFLSDKKPSSFLDINGLRFLISLVNASREGPTKVS